MLTDESESACGLYINCIIETKALLEVTGSHVHFKSGNDSKMVHRLFINKKLYLA